jgi:hypothetical protein
LTVSRPHQPCRFFPLKREVNPSGWANDSTCRQRNRAKEKKDFILIKL